MNKFLFSQRSFNLIQAFCISLLLFPFEVVNAHTWQWLYPKPQGNSLNAVYFTNAFTGYAAGDFSTIIKTTDGGITWTSKYQNHYQDVSFHSAFFRSANKGWVVGYNNNIENGIICMTNDGGDTWSSPSSGSFWDFKLNSVFFINDNTGFIAGMDMYFNTGIVLKTDDGGITWTVTNIGIPYDLYSVYFTDLSTGYIVGGNGIILKTTNGGTTWSTQTSGISSDLYSVFFR